jgi:protein-tyrosine phosphatase
MAEVVLRAELDRAGLAGRVEVDSAGTGDWHLGQPMAELAAAELARRAYDGSAHRARRIQRSWFDDRDLVLAMDLSNLAALRALAPDEEAAGPRLMLFRSFDPDLAGGLLGDPWDGAVPDPYGAPQEAYAQALDLVHGAARGLAGRLAELLASPVPGRAAARDGGSGADGPQVTTDGPEVAAGGPGGA